LGRLEQAEGVRLEAIVAHHEPQAQAAGRVVAHHDGVLLPALPPQPRPGLRSSGDGDPGAILDRLPPLLACADEVFEGAVVLPGDLEGELALGVNRSATDPFFRGRALITQPGAGPAGRPPLRSIRRGRSPPAACGHSCPR